MVQNKATERKEVEALRTSARHFASVRRATTEHLRDLMRVRDIACVTTPTRNDAARAYLRRVVRQRNARLTSGRLAAAAERFAEDAARRWGDTVLGYSHVSEVCTLARQSVRDALRLERESIVMTTVKPRRHVEACAAGF